MNMKSNLDCDESEVQHSGVVYNCEKRVELKVDTSKKGNGSSDGKEKVESCKVSD